MFLFSLLLLNIIFVNSNFLKNKNTVTTTPYNSFKSYDSSFRYNLTQNNSLKLNKSLSNIFVYSYNLK
jgi:hypothetical protein